MTGAPTLNALDRRFSDDIRRLFRRGGLSAVTAAIIAVADDIGIRGSIELAFHRRANGWDDARPQLRLVRGS
jgi:hypothetical protein